MRLGMRLGPNPKSTQFESSDPLSPSLSLRLCGLCHSVGLCGHLTLALTLTHSLPHPPTSLPNLPSAPQQHFPNPLLPKPAHPDPLSPVSTHTHNHAYSPPMSHPAYGRSHQSPEYSSCIHLPPSTASTVSSDSAESPHTSLELSVDACLCGRVCGRVDADACL